MQVKTITTAAGVNEIDFGNDSSQSTAHFYWLKNLSDSTLYVSANPNPIAEKDDVAELPAKGAVSVETDEGKIYVLGAGKVEIHRTNSKFCPFDWQSSGSGGGGGGSITVDSELSDTSTNPLQNKVTTAAINEVNSALETKSDINHIHDITASGNPVIMDNLQDGVPFSEMVVNGKNLIDRPYYVVGDRTFNGITFTDNGDGTITANGTATNNAIYFIRYREAFKLKPGNYVLSGCPAGGSKTSYYMRFDIWDGSTNTYSMYDIGDSVVVTITEDMLNKYLVIGCYVYTGYTADNITFRPQLELGDTATYYEPPIMGRELQVNVSGKNLIGPAQAKALTGDNTNGFYIFDNTASRCIVQKLQPNTTYHLKKYDSGNRFRIVMFNNEPTNAADTTAIQLIYNTDGSISDYTLTTGEDHLWMVLATNYAESGEAVEPIAQLELGGTATDYEPYHGSVTTITPTSNPYTIPDSIEQQEGYNVISVSEGELSVVGVQKNAAIKRIWDKIDMDLLFDGLALAASPAEIDLGDYSKYLINCYNTTDAVNKDYCISIVVEYDRLKNIVDTAGAFIHSLHTSYALELHFSGTMSNANYYAKQANKEAASYYTRIYGIK